MLIDISCPSYKDGQCIIEPKEGRGGVWLSGIDFANNTQALLLHEIGAVLTAADLDIKVDLPLAIKKLPIKDTTK
jgi:hypothetical protein